MRFRVLRLLVSIPLAFGIVAALQTAGVVGSCGSDGNLSGCGGNGPGLGGGSGGGGGGGGGGGAGAPTPTRTPVPTATNTPVRTPTATPVPKEYWMLVGGQYSYESGCAIGDNIDPVTTVLRGGSSSTDVHDRLVAAMDMTHETSEQEFLDNGTCVSGELGIADNGDTKWCLKIVCAQERWHIRGNFLSTHDPAGKNATVMTPHWDSSDGSPIDQCGHVVRPVYDGSENYSGSGFDAGKDKVYWELVVQRSYVFDGAQYWDNRLTNVQCNGEVTGSNGWVNVIQFPAGG